MICSHVLRWQLKPSKVIEASGVALGQAGFTLRPRRLLSLTCTKAIGKPPEPQTLFGGGGR